MRRGAVVGDKYVLVRALGEGAMGAVWAAENQATGREVALKLLHQTNHWSEEIRTRLLREARAYGRIEHENVVAIYDVGATDNGSPFLVMQLLRGQTLQKRIKWKGRLSNAETAKIAHQIASGLAATHAKNVVHRDVKPANVFLHLEANGEETVKILDFGLSKILEKDEVTATYTGSPLGSPAYMSPEQARADKATDHRCDIWALGVCVYEMLVGKQPFVGPNIYQVVSEIVNGRIPTVGETVPGVDPRLEELVARCLVRDVSARMQSAEEAIALLAPLLSLGGAAGAVDSAKIDAIAALDDAETVTRDEASDDLPTTLRRLPDEEDEAQTMRRKPQTGRMKLANASASASARARASGYVPAKEAPTHLSMRSPVARNRAPLIVFLSAVGVTVAAITAVIVVGMRDENDDANAATPPASETARQAVPPSAPTQATPTLEPTPKVGDDAPANGPPVNATAPPTTAPLVAPGPRRSPLAPPRPQRPPASRIPSDPG